MKTKRFAKILSAALCAAVLLSMLAVGALFTQAADTHDAYMYKLTRKEVDDEGRAFFSNTKAVTFQAGDQYRISFLYKMTDGSKFMAGEDPHSPFDFGLLTDKGAFDNAIKIFYANVGKGNQLESTDTAWRRIDYTFSIPDNQDGAKLDKFYILTPCYGSTDEVYLADLKLCKVTDGNDGETLLPEIGSKSDLSLWLNANAGAIGAQTKYSNSCFDLEVLPFDEALFRIGGTPTPSEPAEYMYKFDRGFDPNPDVENHSSSNNYMALYLKTPSITFHEGEVYRISCYYKAEKGSDFAKGHELTTPMEFVLRFTDPDKGTDYLHMSLDGERAPMDPEWRYLQYDVTIPTSMDNQKFVNFGFGTVYPVTKAESVYVAKVSLQKVTDGVAGENLVPDICKKGTVDDWYTGDGDYVYAEVNEDRTSFTRRGDTLTILPYDEEMFKRPEDEAYKVTITGGKIEGGKTSFKPGEKVTIVADEAPAGQMFDFWACSGATLDGPSNKTTFFYIEEDDVVLSAEYTELDDGDGDNENGGDADADNGNENGDQSSGESPKMGETAPYAAFCLLACAAMAGVLSARKLRRN